MAFFLFKSWLESFSFIRLCIVHFCILQDLESKVENSRRVRTLYFVCRLFLDIFEYPKI